MFRIHAAVLLFAASIPALASPTPWVPTPSCTEAMQQALYALPSSSFDSETADAAEVDRTVATVDRRELLAAFAMTLRDIRYRRGGRAPKTGFDCSGFVQYVYQHALGIDLPDNSASQYRDGTQVARDELRTGDLVFFHIRGKRVSHVGIYLDDGRFIHSPSTGKRVRVDDLHDNYWSRRYAGARRPNLSA
jgi:cell wall-associated NlpC family hydrolase